MGPSAERQKTVITLFRITNVFLKILDQSGRKPYKRWVDEGSDFTTD